MKKGLRVPVMLLALLSLLSLLAMPPAATAAERTCDSSAFAPYGVSVAPLHPTLLVPSQSSPADLSSAVERVEKAPGSFVYFLDTPPDALSSAVSGLDNYVAAFTPPDDSRRIISYLVIMPTGEMKVCSMGFSGGGDDLATAIDALTTFLNEVGDGLLKEDVRESQFAHQAEPSGADADSVVGATTDSDPYYRYVGSTGVHSWQYYKPGTEGIWGQTDIWFSAKIIWYDGSDAYDYWIVHMNNDIRPGHYLVGNFRGLVSEMVRYQGRSDGSSNLYVQSPSSNNAPNDTVTVSGLGRADIGYLSWTYTWVGSTLSGYHPYEVVRLGDGDDNAAWDHHGPLNNTYNWDHIINLMPGWNQRENQNRSLVVNVVPGQGTSGSLINFHVFGYEYVNRVTFAVPGYQFVMPKPS